MGAQDGDRTPINTGWIYTHLVLQILAENVVQKPGINLQFSAKTGAMMPPLNYFVTVTRARSIAEIRDDHEDAPNAGRG